MGVDIRLYLPPTVRIDRVAVALGAIHGLPLVKNHFDHHTEGEFYVSCPDVKIRSHADIGIPEMLSFEFETPHGECRSITFHFEADGETPGGGLAAGYRLLSMRTSARNIAVAKRLVKLFGGRVVFNDCGDKTFSRPDMNVPAYKYAAGDAAPYFAMQKRLADIKPLTTKEIAANAKIAAYPYDPNDIHDMGFDVEPTKKRKKVSRG